MLLDPTSWKQTVKQSMQWVSGARLHIPAQGTTYALASSDSTMLHLLNEHSVQLLEHYLLLVPADRIVQLLCGLSPCIRKFHPCSNSWLDKGIERPLRQSSACHVPPEHSLNKGVVEYFATE